MSNVANHVLKLSFAIRNRFICGLLTFVAAPALAGPVGSVLFADGDVQIVTGAGEKRGVAKGDVINEGDVIATGEQASVQVKMRDGGLVAVRPNTQLKFDIFVIATNTSERQSSVMTLVKGSLRAITGLIGRKNKQEYKIDTPVATIGIRGTDHEAAFVPTGSPGVPAGAYSKVNVGQTTLTTAAGTLVVSPNQMGFAANSNVAPQIRPVNTNLFTAAPPPAANANSKKDGGNQTSTSAANSGQSTQQGGQSNQQGGQSNQQGGQTAQNDNQGQNQGQGQNQNAQAGGSPGTQGPAAQSGPAGGQGAGAPPAATDSIRATARVDSTMQAVAINTAPVVERVPMVAPVAPVAAMSPTAATTTAPVATVIPVQLASGTLTLNTTTQTLSTPTGSATTLAYSYDVQAKNAADAAVAAYNSASALASSSASAFTQIAAISLVSTTPASNAITPALDVVTAATSAVGAATALSPASINSAQTYASLAASAATSAATAAGAAQSAVTANGQFADVTAVAANTLIAGASTNAQSASQSAQSAAAAVGTQNAALASAQAAATSALAAANAALTSASASVSTANSNNSTIASVQSAISPLVSQASSAASAAGTAASAAQAAATLAASLQAAGDLTGAAAQLAIAQQQQSIAQQQLSIAQSAYSSISSQGASALSAQSAANSAVSSAVAAANAAAASAGTGSSGAQTYASAAQSAALAAGAALTTAGSQSAAASSSATAAQNNLPIASYFNPKVAGGSFSAVALFPVDATGGYNLAIARNNTPVANSQFVLNGGSSLVEIRSAPFQVLANPAGTVLTPAITSGSFADVAWSGGTGADSFNLPDNSIYLGRWSGANVTVTDNANPGTMYNYSPAQSVWGLVLPPAAGLVQNFIGTVNYSLAGQTLPVDALGNTGVLNSASITADFTSQSVRAGVNLTMNTGPMAGTFAVATASALPISGNSFSTPSLSYLTTSCSGTCAAGSTGYSAGLRGSFGGSGAASAMLSYALWPSVSSSSAVSDSVFGLAAFTAASAPALPASPTTATTYFTNYLVPVPLSGGYTVGETIQPPSLAASSIKLDGSGNLYSMLGTSYQKKDGTGQIASANVVWAGGSAMDYFQSADQSITFGRWQGGSVTVTDTTNSSNALTFNLNQSGSMVGPTSSLWHYSIAPSAGYVQSLTGTASYFKTGNTTPFDSLGGAGSLNSASLTADFSNQMVYAGLQLTMNSGPYATDVFNMSASMPINGASSSNPNGFKVGSLAPVVRCSVGPCTGGSFSGDMRGGFAGATAANALLGYGIWATGTPPPDIINGYVAFNSAPQPAGNVAVAAYPGGELAVQYQSGNPFGTGFIAPASSIVVPSSSSTSPQTISFTGSYEGSGNYSYTDSYATTGASVTSLRSGIRFGASPYSSMSFTSSYPIGGSSGGSMPWIAGPQAYWDSSAITNVVPYIATLSYTKAGGSSAVGMGLNGVPITGTLNSATVTADLTHQTISASVGVTINGGNSYSASSTGMPFSTAGSSNYYAANAFYGSATVTSGSSVNNLTTCVTCSGYISGGFTGQNYAGALLSYNLSDSGEGISYLGGVAALSRTSATNSANGSVTIVSSTPVTGISNYFVGDNYSVNLANSVAFTGTGVLTSYSVSSSSSMTTINCIVCSVNSTSSLTQQTGISFGTWDQGNIQYAYSPTSSPGQLYWITGPEPTPYYLPQVLTQKATYTFAGGAVGTSAGPGTLSSSSSLTADFSKQTVAVNLLGTANVGTSSTPVTVNWTASAANALIGGSCYGNGCFSANTYYGSTSAGYLAAAIDGQSASGSLSGQFTGINLSGAIVSFGLSPNTLTVGSVNPDIQGVAAFSSVGVDPLTPYRLAGVSINDSAASPNSAELSGGYQPAGTVGFDRSTGMLNQILVPPSSASGNYSMGPSNTTSIAFSNGSFSSSSGFLGASTNTGSACNPCVDNVTGISWGRWSTVTVTTTDLVTNSTATPKQVTGGGVHWISTPSLSGPVTLPISGSYAYSVTGGTNPTDTTGAMGTLNSASLTADFTKQTVNLGVNLSMPAVTGGTSTTIAASASNVPIYKGAEFSAGNVYSSSNSAPLTVTCTGSACGTNPQGKVGGVFVGSGGQGAVMGYGFVPNPGVPVTVNTTTGPTSVTNTITGVIGFKR